DPDLVVADRLRLHAVPGVPEAPRVERPEERRGPASFRPHTGRAGSCDAGGWHWLPRVLYARVAPGTCATQGEWAHPCRDPVSPFAYADGGHPPAGDRLAGDREHGVQHRTLRLSHIDRAAFQL